MKLSKHSHSCLLIEHEEKTILLDPGNYTREEQALNIDTLKNLDSIGITHEHADHMDIPTIKQLVEKFPSVQIYSNQSVKEILEKEHLSVSTEDSAILTLEEVKHEKIFFGPSPQNVMITLFNKLSHVGDSFSFNHSAEILALPIQAPWGSTTWAVETALTVKPRIIIPIHDYHWKDTVRKALYDRLEQYFAKFDIDFKKPETGKIFEV